MFIQIGAYKLNMDLILWASKSGDIVNLFFSGGPQAVVFDGENARTVWKAIKASDIANL